MAILIIGLVLLAIPFILVDLFSDKRKGFVYILFFSFLFQILLALLAQFLGIFYYNIVVMCALSADALLLLIYFIIKAKTKKKFSFNIKNIDWAVIAVIIISIFTLYQVHYNYTGKMTLSEDQATAYHEVKNMVYPYPYFSDEWYAVSLVEGAINNHSLPVKNILDNSFFPNLELFFHSFVAQMMLLLGLDPLLQYTVLSILLNTLIIALAYLFLRINNIPKLTAGICSLSMLYITCGANFPGLWHLIPFNTGIIFFLISLCFMELGDVKASVGSIILASLFYPPLIPFYFIGLAVFLFDRMKNKKNLHKIIYRIILLSFFALAVFYVFWRYSPYSGTINYLLSRIFFTAFTTPFMTQLYFYNIIPIPAILLAILGLYYIYKNRKWILAAEFILGAVFWLFYSFTIRRFFAEYERIAVLTSIIVVIIAGFGLKQIEEYIKIKFQDKRSKVVKFAEIIVLLVFLLLAPFYTRGENWKKIIYINPANKAIAVPRAPANNYLTKEDLRIFKGIKNKKFLSVPWKGTTIGVATGNYPALTKEGTISIGLSRTLNNFLKGDCQAKERIASRRKFDYIYLYQFTCPGFDKIDESNEGFILYKVNLKDGY